MEDDRVAAEAEYGKARVRLVGITSPQVLLALLIVIGFVLLWWAIEERSRERREDLKRYVTMHTTTQTLLGTVIDNQTLIIKTIRMSEDAAREGRDEMIFVLTRTQAQREALKLEMPQTLRRKLNDRNNAKFYGGTGQ